MGSSLVAQVSISEAVDRLHKKIQENPNDLDTGRKACASDDINTVPLCRAVFELAKEKLPKIAAATHMIRRGFREEPYVNFLFGNAKRAIEEDVPLMFLYSSDGSIVTSKDSSKGVFNPEFDTWAQSKGLSRQQGIALVNERQVDIISSAFLLGSAPIGPELERGLKHRNEQLAGACAVALAQIDERQAIPLIVARIRELPKDARASMNTALGAFGGPDADKALAEFVPDAKKRLQYQDESLRGTASWRNFKPIPFP